MTSRSIVIDEYLDFIKHEIGKIDERFTGSIDFQMNFRDGGISNMNCTLKKSVKLGEPAARI